MGCGPSGSRTPKWPYRRGVDQAPRPGRPGVGSAGAALATSTLPIRFGAVGARRTTPVRSAGRCSLRASRGIAYHTARRGPVGVAGEQFSPCSVTRLPTRPPTVGDRPTTTRPGRPSTRPLAAPLVGCGDAGEPSQGIRPSRVRIASDDGTRVMAAIRGGVQHPGRSRGRVTGPRSPHQSARPSKDGGGVGGAGLAHQVKSSPGVGHRPCRGRQDRRGVARSRRSRMCCTTSGLGPNPDMRFGRKPGVRSSGTPGLEPAELAARVRHGATGQQFAWPTLGGWSCNEIRWM